MTTASQHADDRAADGHGFGLDAYLARIGLDDGTARRDPGLETLRAVHRAHVMAVPFENLDPLRGTVPSLDLADVQDKLVRRRRGGYCFEQNLLFAGALEALGFTLRRVAARVVLGAERIEDRPRTHMALLVDVPGEPEPFLADVGFGAVGGLLEPVPLTVDSEHHVLGRRHRLVRTRPEDHPLDRWLMQAFGADGWTSQYAFTTEPATPSDYAVANWYVATHPRSPFRTRLAVQRTSPDVHRSLTGGKEGENAELVLTHADGRTERRTLSGADEVRLALVEELGLPAGE